MRTTSGDMYLHAQIFTGSVYIGAAICMWFLRVWKIAELERQAKAKDERWQETRDSEAVLVERSPRRSSMASARGTVKAARGLWVWRRV